MSLFEGEADLLKRIAVALEALNERDQERFAREYPPAGVEPPPRRPLEISHPTTAEKNASYHERQQERLLKGSG